MPKISICIPAYKAAGYLPEALASVRGQTFTDWELIVTEDGSDDGTKALVEAFAQTVSQPVVYQRHPENRGLPATRNTGIADARTEWVALLDADDYWDHRHLDTLVSVLSATGADLAHSGSILFDSATGTYLGIRAPDSGTQTQFPQSLFLGDYIIQPSSVAFRREMWKRTGGFDESFRYVEDREMWLRLARAGARFCFTGENTCHYRKHGEALSTHAADMAIASARVFEKHLDWTAIPESIRRRCARDAWIASARLLQRAEPRRAAEYLHRAGQISPDVRWRAWAAALRLYALVTGK